MGLKDLCDLIYVSSEVLDISPLSKGLSTPDNVLYIVVLCEICIFQVFVVAEEERGKIKSQI